MQAFALDLRYGLRALAKSPAFSAAAIVSLALGIGANTAIFTVANALLLRPLPYADADRLAILWNRSPGLNIAEDWFSTAQYFDIKDSQRSFEQVAIAIGANETLTGNGEPERIGVLRVSSNLLPMLGVRPAVGRLFVAEDDEPGRTGSVVLSDGMFARRYGSNPSVVGTSMVLNGEPYEIVGVLPPGFSLPREVVPTLGVAEDGEVYRPLPLPPAAADVRTAEDYNIVAKLRRGVTIAEAQAEMDLVTARLRRDYPEIYPPTGGLTFSVVPLLDQVVGDVRRPLVVLLAAVGFVLLIACANVANLLLSRALARQRELAVRAALGASRARIGRQLLTESVLLAAAGGALGLLFALAGLEWIRALRPDNVPRLDAIAIDGRVLLFTSALSLAAGVLFGLAPALGPGRLDLHGTLNDASRGSAGAAVWGRGHILRRLLVVAELALSVVLLIGAALLIRSFARLQDVAPGFESRGVLTFELSMTGRRYANGEAVLNAYRDVWGRLDRLPGVVASGGVTSLPLSNFFAWGPITVEGRTPPPGETFINADQRAVGGRYFEAMRIPLVGGRLFTEHDTLTTERVVIVDDHMAQQLWPGEDPIGRRLKFGDSKSDAPWETVVGIVGRVKQYALESDSRIALYRPQTQRPARAMYAVVRSDADPAALAAAAMREIRVIDPDLPVYRVRTMAERVEQSLARRRFAMVLLTLFAGLALVLAAVGIYGVIAYLVTQGTREIGIRVALGATPRTILTLVLRQGLIAATGGVSIGLAGAFGLTRVMRSLLFGVEATDPLTFGGIAGVLTATALLAAYLPARRAARVDPVVALRSE